MDEEVTRDRLADPSDACPAPGELVAFNRGKLPVQRLADVGNHVAVCARCESALRTLTDASDPLIGNLRSSRTRIEYADEPACQRLQARAQALAGSAAGSSAARSGPPERLGPYRIVRRLRSGGMGDVFEARHTSLHRRVALKTLRSDRLHRPELVQRFQREMRAVGKLDHPNIVRASDAGEADGWHFLVMDFVDGFDLGAVVRTLGPLAVADAAEVARRTALGLQCVHEHGLVHRDIKPSNIMLAPGGEVKILDLGLALLREGHPPGDELTDTGMGIGTADYMSPEQAQDAHRVTIQSDLYSLGCTLYKLLAGRAPFDTPTYRTTLAKLQAHQREPVPSIAKVRPELPSGLVAVLDRLLDKDPARRFRTPREVAEAMEPFTAGANLAGLLQTVHEHDTVPAGAARFTPSPPMLPIRTARRLPRWALGLGALALLGAGSVIAVLASRRDGLKGADTTHANDLAWPADYPQTLRDRPLGARIELLRPAEWKDGPRDPAQGFVTRDKNAKGAVALVFQPLWFRRLAGTGRYFATASALVLNSNEISPKQPDFAPEFTALALDDDLTLRWFEFEAEIWAGQRGVRAGIFFGWRPVGGLQGAYFIQVDAPLGDNAQRRRVVVGYLKFPAGSGGVAAPDAPFADLPGEAVAEVPLIKARPRYSLKVRCVPGVVTITADEEPPVQFAPRFETRGSLGIWARRGSAWFGRSSVIAIPP